MKKLLRNLFQKLFGFKNYLFIFSLYSIRKFEKGNYEREFLHFVEIAKNDGIVLDIGANIGITAVPLAKQLNRALIHAYEPITENFHTLTKVTKYLKLSNIELFNLALGSSRGELKMIMPVLDNARMQGLSKAYIEGSGEKGVVYTVPLSKLDDIYRDEANITAIKIDVENFEYEVLKGSIELLKRNKPIIYCELWDNENRILVFELLNSIGYDKYIYDDKLNALKPLIKTKNENSSNNFFFIHRMNTNTSKRIN